MTYNRYLTLEEAARVCCVPLRLLRVWIEQRGKDMLTRFGRAELIERRRLRVLLLARGLPIPPEIEPWPRILIVDDATDMLQVARWTLEELWPDTSVRTADNGEKAWSLLEDWTPDLLVTDLRMPGLNGLELCRRVQSEPALRRTKVLVITADAGLRVRWRVFDHGAAECLIKPFSSEELRRSAVRLVSPPVRTVKARGGSV